MNRAEIYAELKEVEELFAEQADIVKSTQYTSLKKLSEAVALMHFYSGQKRAFNWVISKWDDGDEH